MTSDKTDPSAVIARVRTETFVRHVEWHNELASTNDRALALAAEPDLPTPALVIAERQTAGRGRAANVWQSGPGSVTVSVMIERPAGLPAERTPQISLLAGLAVRQAIATVAVGHPVKVKWPNDVYIDGRKVCGILTEVPAVAASRIVVGFGINANNSFAQASPEIRAKAISLAEATGRPIECDDLLVGTLIALEDELANAGACGGFDPHRWRPHCLLEGRDVRLRTVQGEFAGRCGGVSDSGELLIADDSHVRRFNAGEVVFF